MARIADRISRVALIALAAFGVFLFLNYAPGLARMLGTTPLSDVHAYYDAGVRLNQGLPLYPTDIDVNASEFYRYPPFLAIAFRPLALLPFEVAAAIWEGLMFASLAVAIRIAGVRPMTAIALAGLSFPIAWSLALGQAQVLITGLLAVASPLSVALAGQLKLFPALVAIYFVGRGDWAWVARFIAWTAVLVGIQVVLEPRGSLDFLGIANLEQVGGIDNLSPYGVSPEAWAILAALAGLATLGLARTRHGWAAAVWFSTLVTPRLISYLFMAGLAALGRRDGRERGDRTSPERQERDESAGRWWGVR